MLLSNLFALVSLSTCVLAVGRATITNQCDHPIYLWSVGSHISNRTILPRDSTYGEIFHSDPMSGGIALKITPNANGLTTPNASQLIFAYNIDESFVWYDLSAVFGDGFTGSTLQIQSSDEQCDSITWHDGRTPAGSQHLAVKTHRKIRELAVRIVSAVIIVLRPSL
ncbi:Bys1 family protein [Boeremia exigua]|uniref:Bys1 family protein n=1 Tax=Boeremia exigua TaxID=749465 RepID=UPI001E8E1B24|nr:Bys1 family protein [Boeremia exigua]KAH6644273.1 Bys1 family protein [Boeremia exigua]